METNYKNKLQEYCQQNYYSLPIYNTDLSNESCDNNISWVCKIQLWNGQFFRSSSKPNKKNAEQEAAKLALASIKNPNKSFDQIKGKENKELTSSKLNKINVGNLNSLFSKNVSLPNTSSEVHENRKSNYSIYGNSLDDLNQKASNVFIEDKFVTPESLDIQDNDDFFLENSTSNYLMKKSDNVYKNETFSRNDIKYKIEKDNQNLSFGDVEHNNKLSIPSFSHKNKKFKIPIKSKYFNKNIAIFVDSENLPNAINQLLTVKITDNITIYSFVCEQHNLANKKWNSNKIIPFIFTDRGSDTVDIYMLSIITCMIKLKKYDKYFIISGDHFFKIYETIINQPFAINDFQLWDKENVTTCNDANYIINKLGLN